MNDSPSFQDPLFTSPCVALTTVKRPPQVTILRADSEAGVFFVSPALDPSLLVLSVGALGHDSAQEALPASTVPQVTSFPPPKDLCRPPFFSLADSDTMLAALTPSKEAYRFATLSTPTSHFPPPVSLFHGRLIRFDGKCLFRLSTLLYHVFYSLAILFKSFPSWALVEEEAALFQGPLLDFSLRVVFPDYQQVMHAKKLPELSWACPFWFLLEEYKTYHFLHPLRLWCLLELPSPPRPLPSS